VSGLCVGPGPRSLEALAWLARVGGAPQEPLRLAMGWSESLAYDHVRRLVQAGLVRRERMIRGEGSLILATSAGAMSAGYLASRAPRSLGVSTHGVTRARAWVSAWLELRLRTRWAGEATAWWSAMDVAEDEYWHCEVRYEDRRGTVRVAHRPDLAVQISQRLIAIEIELGHKPRGRLLGTLQMYRELCDGDDAPFSGVIYITNRDDVDDRVRRLADDAGLDGSLVSFRRLEDIIEQTYTAARDRAANRRPVDGEPAR